MYVVPLGSYKCTGDLSSVFAPHIGLGLWSALTLVTELGLGAKLPNPVVNSGCKRRQYRRWHYVTISENTAHSLSGTSLIMNNNIKLYFTAAKKVVALLYMYSAAIFLQSSSNTNDFFQYDFSDVVVHHVLPLLKGGISQVLWLCWPRIRPTNAIHTYSDVVR